MWEIAVHLAVAGGDFDGVFFVPFYPRNVLNGILDLSQFLPTLLHNLVYKIQLALNFHKKNNSGNI